ncbi:MAG TPA: ABC transporter permease [Hyphomicrobiaceae bacterium]|nr:ABC transporter permease [Hyphomicrobiaceae bacterium]
MSGSYDRPPRGGMPLPPPPAPRSRARQEGWTGPSADPYAATPTVPRAEPAYETQTQRVEPSYDSRYDQRYEQSVSEPRSPADTYDRQDFQPDPLPGLDHDLRTDAPINSKVTPQKGSAPIVPAGSVTSKSLTLVVTIMCFLACLTAGAVYMVNQSASAWLNDIASEVTVQVEPREKGDTDRVVREVTAFLGRQTGIRTVRALSPEESAALVEPWLGQTDALSALPVPRLIAIEIDRGQPPDLAAMRQAMTAQFPKGVILDDHRQWQQQIRTVTRSLALGGLAILMLVGAATTAIIISAARSSMASNREIVEVLHFVGATDRFIAGEFERHFQRLGIKSGLVGAICAILVFLSLPTVMELMGGGTVTVAEMQRLVGTGALDTLGYVVLAVVVVVIALLCRLTSRLGVYRILNSQS